MAPIYNKVKSGKEQTFTYNMKSGKVTVFSAPIMGEWYAVMIVNNDKLYQKTSRLIMYDVSLSIALYIIIVVFCTMSRKITMRTLNELDETNNQLIEINDSVMQALAKTIDAKDKYTKGHSERVAKYSREISARMGKSKREQDEIYRVALLHDMGKIRIPDAIINKPGKLTEQEFSMIKLHPVTGYHILKGIRRFKDLGIGAKYHHEHYDGTGYPSGLKGENIPEIARIIAVADSYDAMASNRSYRNALPQEVVRGEIEKGKGTQFDPEIADIMLQMIDEDKNYDMKQTDELKRTILVVDDQKMNLMLVKGICKDEPMYEILTAQSGKEAIDIVKEKEIDLLLLDIEMPEMDGFDTLSQIRGFSDVKAAFITATRDYDTIEKAREMGVEDYITKPFDIQEALARVEVQLRRNNEKYEVQKLSGNGMMLDKDSYRITIDDRELETITKQEFAILELLLRYPKKVFSKEEIFEYAWEEPYMGETKTLDVHVSNIRKKIKKVSEREYIETVWGIGYRLHP